MQNSPEQKTCKKCLTVGDSWPQTPLAFLDKCPFKDHFYGISALLCSSQWRETKRRETEGVTCSKGPRQDLNPRCYYCTWPALWATDLPRQSSRDLLIQLYPCPFQFVHNPAKCHVTYINMHNSFWMLLFLKPLMNLSTWDHQSGYVFGQFGAFSIHLLS